MLFFFVLYFIYSEQTLDYHIENDTIYFTNKSHEINQEFSELLNLNPQILYIFIDSTIKIIGDSCFMNCIYIKKVNITGFLESIGNNCFFNCQNLTEIIIPMTVKSIGFSCFSNCKQLKYILLPSNIEIIEEKTFLNCVSLTNILVTHQVKFIKKAAFSGCINVKTVRLSPILENISDFAFQNCHKLEKVILPSTIKWIGINPFSNCYSLNNITFNGINEYYTVLDNCIISNSSQKSLQIFFGTLKNNHFNVPNDIEKIDSYAFSGSVSLSAISFPYSLSYISSYSFNNCSNLVEIILPENLTTIENYAFYMCKSLRFIEFPQNIPNFDGNPFILCDSIEEISVHQSLSFLLKINLHLIKKLRIRGNNDALNYAFPTGFLDYFKEITIEESIYEINRNSLCDLPNLEKISLPNSIKNIDLDNSFLNCPKLTQLSVFSSLNGNISNIIIDFIKKKEISTLDIKDKINIIQKSAFNGFNSLKSIYCSDSVVEIQDFAFSNCEQLKTIISSQNLHFIGLNPFMNSPNCEYLSFGSSQKKENNWFVYNFPYLFNKNYSTIIAYLPIKTKRNLIKLPNSVKEIRDYSFYQSAIHSIYFDYNLQKIGSFAFSKSSLESLTIPYNISEISFYAFSDCFNLSKIKYCGTKTIFSNTIFYNCLNITEVICSTHYKSKTFCGLAITEKVKKCDKYNEENSGLKPGDENNNKKNSSLQKFLKIYIYIVIAVVILIIIAFIILIFSYKRKVRLAAKQQDLQKMLIPENKNDDEPIPLPPGYVPPFPTDEQTQPQNERNDINFEFSSTTSDSSES